MEITFKVKGSSEDPYEVVFIYEDEKLNALCNCQAGNHGLYCKHRIEILAGESKSIVSENEKDIQIVGTWLSGSELELVLQEISEKELMSEKIKKDLKKLKKKLSRLMHG